jgi:hypothetical protein
MCEQTLLQKVEALEVALAKRTNSAYVFIKPHAVNDKVCKQQTLSFRASILFSFLYVLD